MNDDIIWQKLNENMTDFPDSWKPSKNDELIGKYVSKREHAGKWDKNVYTLEKRDGTQIAVWGNTQIDRELAKAQVGDIVKLVYLGKMSNPNTGNSFHSYDVYVGKPNPSAKKKTPAKVNKDNDDIPF